MSFAKPKFAKVGIFGEQKSGKTYSVVGMACGLLKKIGTGKPLKVFDTDGGFSYQLDRIRTLTGKDPEGVQAQSFPDLLRFTQSCEDGDVVVIDSVSNPWLELFRAAKKRYKFFVSAAGAAKDEWAPFSDWVKASNCHVFICGRLAYEYEDTIDEDSGKTKSVKSGTRMKTESDLGYEPSLLLEISREQRKDGIMGHEILVKGDRFALLDGQKFMFLPEARLHEDLTYNPVFDALEPWFSKLDLSGQGTTGIDTTPRSGEIFADSYAISRRAQEEERKVLLEEIQSDLVSAFPGQSAQEKKLKADLVRTVFGTGSWLALETNHQGLYPNAMLRDGRGTLKLKIQEILLSTQEA